MPLAKIKRQCCGCKIFFSGSFVITFSCDGIRLSDRSGDCGEITQLYVSRGKTGRKHALEND